MPGKRAGHRDQTQQLAPAPPAGATFRRHAEGHDRSAAGSAAEGHLSDDAGRGDQDHEEDVGDQKVAPP